MTKIKKQILTVVILAVVMALLGASYYLLTKEGEAPVEEKVQYGPFGETLKNGRPFIVDKIDNEQMNSITVHNAFDEYSLIHKKSGAYKLEGLDGYEVNQEMLAQLRVNALNLLATGYVENAELDNLEQYGIDKNNPTVWFEVLYNNEQDSYKIIVGDKTPDGSGYYAMLEGRDALYTVDTGLESAILLPRRAYVTPKPVSSVESNYVYTLKDFTLYKKGEKFISIEKASSSLTYGNNSSHFITYPAYNYATNLANFEGLLTTLKELTGTETLYYADAITDELLCELGFFDAQGNDISDYSFTYSYPTFSEQLYVMKDGENGYIVYSLNKNIIVRMDEASMRFLNWDMLLWVSVEIYLLDIEDIASVVFEYDGKTASYNISGAGAELTVTGNNIPVDVTKFKEIYKSIMYVIVTAYADDADYGKEQLKMTVTTEKGEMLEYSFYAHTATNSYYTLNGFGEFYVSAEKVLALRDSAFALAK